jgi:hypothetical protein
VRVGLTEQRIGLRLKSLHSVTTCGEARRGLCEFSQLHKRGSELGRIAGHFIRTM